MAQELPGTVADALLAVEEACREYLRLSGQEHAEARERYDAILGLFHQPGQLVGYVRPAAEVKSELDATRWALATAEGEGSGGERIETIAREKRLCAELILAERAERAG